VAVGIDESWNDNAVRGVDHRGSVSRYVGPYCTNLAVFDKDVRLCKIAHLRIQSKHGPAFDQRARPCLYFGERGIVSGRALAERGLGEKRYEPAERSAALAFNRERRDVEVP
jgi:hypothetical protein